MTILSQAQTQPARGDPFDNTSQITKPLAQMLFYCTELDYVFHKKKTETVASEKKIISCNSIPDQFFLCKLRDSLDAGISQTHSAQLQQQ